MEREPKSPDDRPEPAAAAAQPQPQPLEWRFAQVFGERAAGEDVQDVDIISAIEFDKSGNHLATGDRGGRVVLFERTDIADNACRGELERQEYLVSRHPEFRYKTEFQSHEPEFDYLKSLEIEEKINKIKWCQTTNNALFLLSTNDKTIKYWKVQEKKVKRVSVMNLDTSQSSDNGSTSSPGTSSCRALLPNGGCTGKMYSPNNNMSFPPGGCTSLRLPVVVVLKPTSSIISRLQAKNLLMLREADVYMPMPMTTILIPFQIIEVITCAEFHPTHCNTLAYSSSKGTIRLIDLRQSALCDNHAKLFEEHEAPGSRSFFTEIIASVSDIKFARDGRHILSRDYMTLKLWDLNMDSGPVATFQVHEYLRPKLCDLYENDSIFDKFECCLSGDGLHVATGSYSNLFRVFGCSPESVEASTLEASRNPMRRQVADPARPARTLTGAVRRGGENTSVDASGNSCDLSTKLLHLAWHPTENSIACAAANSLYMYYA
ncbi:Serine/threonine protein phosphatase 2A 55 kDa regulatory subunit B beta isoform [Zea mays]|uniref:Serine/threonine-protein phosphatase 2A 55 kDa regulatory subunit B n=1 Tax=Zea mays TaxID=4577 RepID=A0A1D6QQ82_MAIZE|nr:Serine/threonine protein phosphatase 2A 55 kDa regulatory subunit B beta isoform [Zea mays]